MDTRLLASAGDALRFCLEIGGALCLWSALLELMETCGLSALLTGALKPLLRRLFPEASREEGTLCALSENLGANLLGLGNAATPAGIRAAREMAKRSGGLASDELCLLVVLNTASVQLLPSAAAALRAAAGAKAPFDIVGAVWFSSCCSLLAGLGTAALLRRLFPCC